MRPIDVDPLEHARRIVYDYVLRRVGQTGGLRPRASALLSYSSASRRLQPVSGIALYAVVATIAAALVVLGAVVWFFSA
ncbi:MAG: hypothetical protein ACLQPV_08620 [Vulcanimicrobiaceae bacterium]